MFLIHILPCMNEMNEVNESNEFLHMGPLT
jgi:hypothetical protein